MNEKWTYIAGTDNRYMVSTAGRVISCFSWDVATKSYIPKVYFRSPCDNGNGYPIVSLIVDGKKKNFYIHRLVAEAFLENPNDLPVVNHKDFNKWNNDVSNLEWMTQRENIRYSSERMKRPHRAKLPNSGERYIRKKKTLNK